MKKFFQFLSITLLLISLVVILLNIFFYDVVNMKGDDMIPGYGKGAWLVIRKGQKPRRGDVLLFKSKDGPHQIRRLMALPGETIAHKKERPVIDGTTAKHEEVRRYQVTGRTFRVMKETLGDLQYEVIDDTMRRTTVKGPYQVKDGYYVMADNREHARDSRQYGAVAIADVRGVVVFTLSAGASP